MIAGELRANAVVLSEVMDGSSKETQSGAVQGGGTAATMSM